MTILFNQDFVEFDFDPALKADDRAQPICVDPSDEFVTLRQQVSTGNSLHYILIERRDVRALIKALEKML